MAAKFRERQLDSPRRGLGGALVAKHPIFWSIFPKGTVSRGIRRLVASHKGYSQITPKDGAGTM